MFSARIGFLGGSRSWWQVTNTEIISDISTWTRTASYASTPAASLSGKYPVDQAYLGGTLHTNGNIYYAPFAASTNSVIAFDPVGNVATVISTGKTFTGTYKYYSGVLTKSGKIYFPPINAGKMLILDPDNNHACEEQTWGLTLGNYDCSVYVPEYDKIYCIGTAAHCLIVDVAANTAVQSTFGGVITGSTSNRYVAGTYSLKNQRVVFAPYNTASFLIVNPATDTATSQTWSLTISKTQGCTNGKDGNVWATATTSPESRTYTLDLSANTATIASSQFITSGASAGMGADGNVWVGAFPGSTAGGFANVDTRVVQDNPSFLTGTGVSNSKSNMVLHPDGNIYAITQATNGSITRVNTQGSGKNSAILREIALSAYINTR